MADALIHLLQGRTVLVQAGSAVGTGTLIAPGVVLTCAHVVRDAKNAINTISVALPSLEDPGKPLWTEPAINLHLSNKYEEPNEHLSGTDDAEVATFKKEYPDVAIIEIKSKKHDLIEVQKYKKPLTNLKEKQFLAYGFSNQDADLERNSAEGISLIYSGEQVDGIIRKLIFVQGHIRPGMSGAGLVERESGKLIGIVQMTKSKTDDLGAYVIPIDTIWQVIQNWSNDGLNELFITLRSKELEANVKKQYNKDYPQFSLLRKHWLKLSLFLVLIFFSLFWGFFHRGLTTASGTISIFFVAVSLFSVLIGGWLGKGVNEETIKFKDKFGKFLLGKAGSLALLGLLGVLIYLWTYRSSVWINGYSESDKVEIRVLSGENFEETKTITLNPKGKANAMFSSVPSGETVKITSKGRKDTTMILKSFNRIDLFYPRDFPLEPVAIFRFDPAYASSKKMNDYRLEVLIERKVDSVWEEVYNFPIIPDMTSGCFVLGRNIEAKERETVWEDALINDLKIKTNTKYFENSLKIWKNFKYIEDKDLNYGDKITIQVYGKRNGISQPIDSIYNSRVFFLGGNSLDKFLNLRTK